MSGALLPEARPIMYSAGVLKGCRRPPDGKREDSLDTKELLTILRTAAELKLQTRHCETAPGRRESVADHCWRLAFFAMLLRNEPAFGDTDMDKVIRMCLLHDMGEAFTGDIPAFLKTDADAGKESALLEAWFRSLPSEIGTEYGALWREMEALETPEAKTYQALDKLEAVISHNESDISTWLPLEYDLQQTYGREECAFSPYFRALFDDVGQWTRAKIEAEGPTGAGEGT